VSDGEMVEPTLAEMATRVVYLDVEGQEMDDPAQFRGEDPVPVTDPAVVDRARKTQRDYLADWINGRQVGAATGRRRMSTSCSRY
jgi:hypothetical protein